ncbi:MAG TPA: PA14 domain-containing protein [Gaiellaceae bacterium]|nr:PA14 domain-containing protein [Gaiellaceae bacterium]
MTAALVALAALVLLGPAGAPPPAPEAARAGTLPNGFQETVAFSGLTNPMVVRFASDGRVFVAEKSGLIKVFDSLSDTTPTVFADLRTNVYNFWDRGLLGMALDPAFPSSPYVYVSYTYDHILGSSDPPPRWGSPGATSDPCPSPPGATSDGCVVSGRVSRLQAAGNVMTGSEQVLVEDWCQQYPSHSVGTVEFGPDGNLYASGGDGASFNFVDYGQDGSPLNPCGDPPGGPGATLTPPTAEGGALRSQDLRTSGDPTSLDGSIIRIDPATGAAPSDNPLAGASDPNARRIVAYGLRNPFRFTFRPGTSELWIGDVGWNDWEEINRITSPTDAVVENFGWPCYEGNTRQSGYDSANLNICENLYGAGSGAVTTPHFAYHHSNKVVSGESCPTGSSSVAGLSFEFSPTGGNFPSAYQGALFFADYSRDCIWVMRKDANGVPAPGLIETFVAAAANPVNLEFGPGGDLFYPDFDGGTIRRIHYAGVPTTCPTGQYLADYYSNVTLTGSPTLTRCESAIDYAWGGSGPGFGVPVDNFSARWEGTFDFPAGETVFTATSDDGIRLWLDGQLLIDGWVNQSATTYTATRTLTAGSHAVKVEYYEAGGDAVAQVGWSSPPPTSCPGEFLASYYSNQTLSGTAALVRCEAAIDHTWGLGGPGGTVPIDHFSARWTGSFDFPAGATEFTVTADDGIRLWVDGDLLIDRWIDQSATTYTATKTLTAGAHDIRVEYYENAVDAVARVSWAPAATNAPPSPSITAPTAATTWRVGTSIAFNGSAGDPEDGPLPASALSWSLLLYHCPSNCHTHTLQSWSGVASGSFAAPDHEYPSYLELQLTATDSGGLTGTTSVRLDPETVVLGFASSPSGLQLAVNGVSSTTPFNRTVIVGSSNSVSATSPQTLGGTTYAFQSWSDGGAQTHNLVAPATGATYTATYAASAGTAPANTALPSISGQPKVDQLLTVSDGTWTGSTPMAFGYQWLRCAMNGASCTPIAGATAKTYTPVTADVGSRLRATVTATNAAGSASATSAPTAGIKRK